MPFWAQLEFITSIDTLFPASALYDTLACIICANNCVTRTGTDARIKGSALYIDHTQLLRRRKFNVSAHAMLTKAPNIPSNNALTLQYPHMPAITVTWIYQCRAQRTWGMARMSFQSGSHRICRSAGCIVRSAVWLLSAFLTAAGRLPPHSLQRFGKGCRSASRS